MKVGPTFLAALVLGACHDFTDPKSPTIACGSDESALDGVCVSKKIANYVSCVRAQGATLGEDRAKKLAADVGYAGAHAGAVSDAHESLARKYSVSDQAVLAVVNMCNELARGEAAPKQQAPNERRRIHLWCAANGNNHWYGHDAVLDIAAGSYLEDQQTIEVLSHDDSHLVFKVLSPGGYWSVNDVRREGGGFDWKFTDSMSQTGVCKVDVPPTTPKSYTFQAANFWSDVLLAFHNETDSQRCARACEDNAACKVASLHDATVAAPWTNTCVLRSTSGDSHADPGVTSWLKP